MTDDDRWYEDAVNTQLSHVHPSVRQFLELSTNHLPEYIMQNIENINGVIAYGTDYGAWLWVPDNPRDHSRGYSVPDEILTIQLYARKLDCDYILLDGDAPLLDALPFWEW